MFRHRRLYLGTALIRKTPTSTARSEASAEAANAANPSCSGTGMHQLMIGIQMLRLLSLAAVAMVMAVSPETADAQEYPWCVSRESYLYCFYQTLQQCQWTASGGGGCAPNPRLLFPNKPRDSNATSASRLKPD
jgi:hypothetical protein